MTLTSGTKLGPYEIHSSIGAGGMGEVYRARDGRLNRDVAIKILPASFSSSGAQSVPSLCFSADGKSYVYSLGRMLSELVCGRWVEVIVDGRTHSSA